MQTIELFASVPSLTVWGYLDPGTGSYALQLILAGVFGGMFAVKQSWHQLRGWMAPLAPGRRGAASAVEGTD